jgi:hypothetical protein
MSETTDDDEVRLTPQQTAKLLGVTEDCLYRWRAAKVGPRFYRRVGRIFYLKTEVRLWEFSNPGN